MFNLLCSVKKIIDAQGLRANKRLIGASYLKLVDFVCPYLSSSHLATPNGEFVVSRNIYIYIKTKNVSKLKILISERSRRTLCPNSSTFPRAHKANKQCGFSVDSTKTSSRNGRRC
jgi:hypothetical protein